MTATSTGGRRAAVVAGFVLHLLLLPVFLAFGLVVPWPALAGLLAVWALLLVAAVRWRDRPAMVLAVPAIALVVLVAVVTLGEWLLDWRA